MENDLDNIHTELNGVSEELDKFAEEQRLEWWQSVQAKVHDLKDEMQELKEEVRAFVRQGPGQEPDGAMRLYGAISEPMEDAKAAAADSNASGSGRIKKAWQQIIGLLKGALGRIWSLISQLTSVKEWTLNGKVSGGKVLDLFEVGMSITFGIPNRPISHEGELGSGTAPRSAYSPKTVPHMPPVVTQRLACSGSAYTPKVRY